MSTMNEKIRFVGTAEYGRNFWNVMRGNTAAIGEIHGGTDTATGGYFLPSGSSGKLEEAILSRSLFRNLATVVKAYGGSSRIFAKDTSDLAAWVPENGDIPIYNGMDDFTRYAVDSHKLAVFVRLDNDFVHDASFSVEDYLTDRLAQNFAKAEDSGFVSGTGEDMPTGILCSDKGAETALTVDTIGFDDVVSLFFSLDDEYRRNAVWMMNDETALKLRLLKDNAGNYLWNHADGTILSRPVTISNDMPSEKPGSMPIVFGDFHYYWIILRSPVSMRTLKEKFVAQNQIGYLATRFLDAKLIRREAVKAIRMSDAQPSGAES